MLIILQGSFNDSDYAILQSIPFGSSEDLNSKDLLDELALMTLGQYFLSSFYKRAACYKVKGLPREFLMDLHAFRY